MQRVLTTWASVGSYAGEDLGDMPLLEVSLERSMMLREQIYVCLPMGLFVALRKVPSSALRVSNSKCIQ
jgi:hypothetical protein